MAWSHTRQVPLLVVNIDVCGNHADSQSILHSFLLQIVVKNSHDTEKQALSSIPLAWVRAAKQQKTYLDFSEGSSCVSSRTIEIVQFQCFSVGHASHFYTDCCFSWPSSLLLLMDWLVWRLCWIRNLDQQLDLLTWMKLILPDCPSGNRRDVSEWTVWTSLQVKFLLRDS